MSQDKLPMPSNAQPPMSRKRLGSMSESERLSFERRSVLRRQSADIVSELKNAMRWNSRENVSLSKSLDRGTGLHMQHESMESEEINEYQPHGLHFTGESTDLGSDYTESTASSELDSIEKFKMELKARTRSPSPRELETYHPRDMSAGIFTPYRVPTPDNAALVLNRPVPLPSPDFVPKPILKRSSNENFSEIAPNSAGESMSKSSNGNKANNSVEGAQETKLDITKGIKSFFKRDKRNSSERNTDQNQLLSNPTEKSNAATIAADIEAKKKVKEEEELKRKEDERIVHEESLATVDHYSDLVSQITKTRKYHTPLYLDSDQLKKVTAKASQEGLDVEHDIDIDRDIQADRKTSIPKTSDQKSPPTAKMGTSTVEAQQTMPVVRPTKSLINTNQDMGSTNDEQPDARGRTRIVKVKRIIKKRIPSKSRNRDISSSRTADTLCMAEAHAKSPESQARRKVHLSVASRDADEHTEPEVIVVEQVSEEEAHEKVRSALSYSTDLVLFLVACYVYLFKEARLVLPILALMIYRQLGEAISNCIPNWLRHKKN